MLPLVDFAIVNKVEVLTELPECIVGHSIHDDWDPCAILFRPNKSSPPHLCCAQDDNE